MKYSLVIFDLDGTLVDSERCITASMTAALEESGLVGDLPRLKRHIGLSLERSIRGVVQAELDELLVAKIAHSYRRHYALLQGELVDPYPGTIEAIGRLSDLGVGLAIATSKVTTAVDATLQHLDIAGYFTCVVGGEQVVNGKPDPDMLELVLERTRRGREESLMVGDTIFDVEMARSAGIASCAVTYGNHTVAQLSEARPNYMAASMDDVVNLVIG